MLSRARRRARLRTTAVTVSSPVVLGLRRCDVVGVQIQKLGERVQKRLGRLRAADLNLSRRTVAVARDDEVRHAANARARRRHLLLHDRLERRRLAVGEHFGNRRFVQTRGARRVSHHGFVARRERFDEVSVEHGAHEGVLRRRAVRFLGVSRDAVRRSRVAGVAVERVRALDPRLRERAREPGLERRHRIGAKSFVVPRALVHARARDVGAHSPPIMRTHELKWSPNGPGGRDVGTKRGARAVEVLHADVTPRSHDVGDDLDRQLPGGHVSRRGEL